MQLNPRTIQQAIIDADATYELILSNWGNRGVAQDKNNGSIQFPPVRGEANGNIPLAPTQSQLLAPPPGSVFGIALDPRSDVNQCIIRSVDPARPFLVPPDTDGFINQGGILPSDRILSAEAPFVGQVTGPIIVAAHPSSWFGDTFTKLTPEAAPETAAFGTAAGSAFQSPVLRVRFGTANQGILPFSRRAPYDKTFFFPEPTGPETELLIAAIPITGRRRGTVSMRLNAPGPLFVGGVVVAVTQAFTAITNGASPTTPVIDTYEAPVDGGATFDDGVDVRNNTVRTFSLPNLGGNFLLVQCRTFGGGRSFNVHVTLFD